MKVPLKYYIYKFRIKQFIRELRYGKPKDPLYKLHVLHNRLKRLGIDVEYGANYPWVYLDKINDKNIKEILDSDHGFVIGYTGVTYNSSFKFNKPNELFKLIRKYL